MKVHLSVNSPVLGLLSDALDSWEKGEIIPSEQRNCDGLMMDIKDREFLTKDYELVTCKRCLDKF